MRRNTRRDNISPHFLVDELLAVSLRRTSANVAYYDYYERRYYRHYGA